MSTRDDCCDGIFKLMDDINDCLDMELIETFLRFEDHLTRCPVCEAVVKALRIIKEMEKEE